MEEYQHGKEIHGAEGYTKGLMARLTKPTPPPIHPDVPVLVGGGPWRARTAIDNGWSIDSPLIPTEAVIRWAECLTFPNVKSYFTNRVDHYIKTGEIK